MRAKNELKFIAEAYQKVLKEGTAWNDPAGPYAHEPSRYQSDDEPYDLEGGGEQEPDVLPEFEKYVNEFKAVIDSVPDDAAAYGDTGEAPDHEGMKDVIDKLKEEYSKHAVMMTIYHIVVTLAEDIEDVDKEYIFGDQYKDFWRRSTSDPERLDREIVAMQKKAGWGEDNETRAQKAKRKREEKQRYDLHSNVLKHVKGPHDIYKK
tara:strand:+ start:88 stop:705 length:618 start_codon:yes stop_codon:yes gene_type:complete